MLGLKLPTDPRWVNLAEISLEAILTDHAYCEQKAATTMISLIVQFPDYEKMVKEIAPVVTEEWGHFRMVLNEIFKRGYKFGLPRKDKYVEGLIKFLKKDGSRADKLTDKLLMCAMIEARSCERFKTLSEGLDDEYLKNFYYKFMVSEASHYKLFIELANDVKEENFVNQRWEQWLKYEAELLKNFELRGDRIH